MKKLLLTAALGLGLGGGAWKYQNPEGTLDDFRTQAEATKDTAVERVKVAVQAVRSTSSSSLQELEEQQNASSTQQDAESQALQSRLVALEQMVIANSGNESSAATELKLAQTTAGQTLEEQESLKTSISSLETTLSSLQASVSAMEENNTAELARIDAIDSRLELLMRRVDEQTFDAEIASVKEGLQVLGADVLDVQSTLTQQESTVSSDISSVNERANALDNRLNTLASLAQQNKASSESGDNQASSELSGAALASLSAGIDDRFGALEERLQTVNADSRRLGNVDEQLNSLRTDIASLKEQSSSTDRSLSEISANLEGLKTTSESMSIETVQAEIREQLATAQSQLENDRASDNSSELETLISATRNRISTLEQRVQGLPASSAEADIALQSQSALKSQITALEKRLETINKTDPDLVNTLTSVQQQVDELTSKGFVTQEDLIKSQSEGSTIEYKIFFDSNSSEINAAAAKALNAFIAEEKSRTIGVSIYGFTDRIGSASYNQKLAEQRATNVRSFVIQNGMDYTKIKALTGLGEDAAAIQSPDNAEDSQQRVVVLYAEQP